MPRSKTEKSNVTVSPQTFVTNGWCRTRSEKSESSSRDLHAPIYAGRYTIETEGERGKGREMRREGEGEREREREREIEKKGYTR